MYKVLKTKPNGEKRIMLLNTATWHRVKNAPSIFLPDKYELVVEEAPEPVVTILGEDDQIDDQVEYGDEEYKKDVATAKKFKDDTPIEVLERMVEYKPTPYWKGKLNKRK